MAVRYRQPPGGLGRPDHDGRWRPRSPTPTRHRVGSRDRSRMRADREAGPSGGRRLAEGFPFPRASLRRSPTGMCAGRAPPATGLVAPGSATLPGTRPATCKVGPLAPGSTVQDCLYLNVSTPTLRRRHAARPGLVHGGGLTQDGARDYDGTKLAPTGPSSSPSTTASERSASRAPALAARPGKTGRRLRLDRPRPAALGGCGTTYRALSAGFPNNVTITGESAGRDLSVLAHLVSRTSTRALPAGGRRRARCVRARSTCRSRDTEAFGRTSHDPGRMPRTRTRRASTMCGRRTLVQRSRTPPSRSRRRERPEAGRIGRALAAGRVRPRPDHQRHQPGRGAVLRRRQHVAVVVDASLAPEPTAGTPTKRSHRSSGVRLPSLGRRGPVPARRVPGAGLGPRRPRLGRELSHVLPCQVDH